MKIPTKHTNSKRTLFASGALVTALSLTPVAALAHGGGDSSHHYDWNKHRSSRHFEHGSWLQRDNRWGGLGWLSADRFDKLNTKRLAIVDRYIDRHDLTIENGDSLKADINTAAANVEQQLTKLQAVRNDLKDTGWDNVTAEQENALKDQIKMTLSALVDYHFAWNDYVSAVRDAARSDNVTVDLKVSQHAMF